MHSVCGNGRTCRIGSSIDRIRGKWDVFFEKDYIRVCKTTLNFALVFFSCNIFC